MATDGWVLVVGVDEREVMKSETMALWEGVNLPYHIKWTVILPVRRGPLWYWNLKFWDDWERVLAAELKWMIETKRRTLRTIEEE